MKPQLENRACYKCNKVLPLDDFKTNRNSTKGKAYICKKCHYIKKKERYQDDVQTRIAQCLRVQLRRLIKNRHTAKNSNIAKYLGCSIGEFVRYIEANFQEGMSWENHGYDGWHLDHIIPCINFDLTKDSEIKKCFHYMNIQPLWKNQNLEKGTRVLKEVDGTQVFWSPCEESVRGPIMGPNIFEEF